MRRNNLHRAFTLVEILIVVVILGILAAIVVPQFLEASTEANKSAIKRQLQTVFHQIELYRTRNSGAYPTDDGVEPMAEGGTNDGWGILVSGDYLKEAPVNTYSRSAILVEGDGTAAEAASPEDGIGWFFQVNGTRLDIWAAGYDPDSDELWHEYIN